MAAVFLQGERLDRDHVRKVERPVDMGEQRAPVRRPPAKLLSWPVGVDGKRYKVALPCEVFCQGPGDLMPCRQVDKTVAGVDGGTLEAPAFPRLSEGSLRADLVDRFSHAMERR